MDNDPHRQPFAVDQGVDASTLSLFAVTDNPTTVNHASAHRATTFWVRL
jgi:hypothetical protein